MTNAVEVILQVIVEHAGGRYVGIQRPQLPWIPYSLVLFNAPSGSTLAERIDVGFTTEKIRQRIAESEARFAGGAN